MQNQLHINEIKKEKACITCRNTPCSETKRKNITSEIIYFSFLIQNPGFCSELVIRFFQGMSQIDSSSAALLKCYRNTAEASRAFRFSLLQAYKWYCCKPANCTAGICVSEELPLFLLAGKRGFRAYEHKLVTVS